MRQRSRHLILIAAATLIAGAARAGDLRQTQNEIAGLLAHPVLREAEVGAQVLRLGDGREIYAQGADRRLIPASNMKLVIVATALELLGAEWTPKPGLCELPAVPLSELAPRILLPSDNALADALQRALPAAAGRPEISARRLCAETWGERGLHMQGLCWLDGSGLERGDLLTPAFTAALLRYMGLQSRWGELFRASLPVAGRSGTLRHRMLGTVAEGRIQAKTGTLTGVSTLSGYAKTISGEELVFSMMMNGFDCDVARVRRIQDAVCLSIVTMELQSDAPTG